MGKILTFCACGVYALGDSVWMGCNSYVIIRVVPISIKHLVYWTDCAVTGMR